MVRDMKALTIRFTDSELDLIQDAAGDQAPEDFIRTVVLSVAAASMEGDEGEADKSDRGDDQAGDDDDGLAAGAAAELIERLNECTTMGREMIARNQVLTAELLAHTRYRDAAHEAECRAQAKPRYRKLEELVRKLIDHDPPEGPAN